MTPRSLLLALLLFSLPAIAQQPNDEIAVSYGQSTYSQFNNAPAIGLSYAHHWDNGIAARFGLHRSDKEFPDNQGSREVRAYYATAEYHFFRNSPVSLFVGGGVAYGSARQGLSHGFTAEDSTFSAIGDMGIDVKVSSRFAIGADVSYMRFDPNLGDRHGSALHPITLLASVKYRF